MIIMDAAIDTVTSKFNIVLKDKQKEVIHAFLSAQNAFISLPTGYGKSLIYALLPLIFDSIRGKELYMTYIYM